MRKVSFLVLLCAAISLFLLGCGRQSDDINAEETLGDTFTYTVSKRIAPDMPEFAFDAVARKWQGDALWDFDDPYLVRIAVIDENSKVIQTIEEICDPWQDYADEGTRDYPFENLGLYFDDWNFDGYLDISLINYQYRFSIDNRYYWLWDNQSRLFVRNNDLLLANDNGHLEIDAESQTIQSFEYGMGVSLVETYRFDDGLLVKIHRKYSEAQPVDADIPEGDWRWHIVVEELIDGEMVVTEDYYEPIETQN